MSRWQSFSKGCNVTLPQPTISVVIPCYNYANFVCDAIDSVLSQDYQDTEVIVVDDASSDNSREVISKYGNRFKIVFKEINEGHAAAFNSGFAVSSGDIVVFLDADDFLLPGALTRIAKNGGLSVPMCQYRMSLVNSQGEPYDIFPKLEQPFLTGDQKSRLLRTGRVPTTVTSGLVFKRNFLEKIMPIPPEAFRQGADGYLATLAPLYGPLGEGGPEPISAYRQHNHNHSGFGAVAEKRAFWCVQHDEARYAALRTEAGRLHETPVETLGWADEGHLCQKMALTLSGMHPNPQPSRLKISLAALKVMRDLPASYSTQVLLSVWWLSLSVLPKNMALNVHRWRLYAATRPTWLKRSARLLRKL